MGNKIESKMRMLFNLKILSPENIFEKTTNFNVLINIL
jgi:hypothetical protein